MMKATGEALEAKMMHIFKIRKREVHGGCVQWLSSNRWRDEGYFSRAFDEMLVRRMVATEDGVGTASKKRRDNMEETVCGA